MNFPHFCLTLFKLKFCGEIVHQLTVFLISSQKQKKKQKKSKIDLDKQTWKMSNTVLIKEYSDPLLHCASPIAASLFSGIFYNAFFTVNCDWLRGVTVV